jgi:SAM-dependent methyltransferase
VGQTPRDGTARAHRSGSVDHDSARGVDVAAAAIAAKPFLRRLHAHWRALIVEHLPVKGVILEVGCGANPLVASDGSEADRLVVRVDVRHGPAVTAQASALALPLQSASVAAICMVDVFHHLPDARRFLYEMDRVLADNGVLVMIEPWKTPWSSFVYRLLHHEPFDPSADWTTGDRPMSDANLALPWIVFSRDRDQLARDHPSLSLERLRNINPLAYVISGGISSPVNPPALLFPVVRLMERLPFIRKNGLSALVVVRKTVKHHMIATHDGI